MTKAGNGGDEALSPLEATGDEGDAAGEGGEAGPPLGTRGDSGRVSAISPYGDQTVVAHGLPSYQEGVGPTGIVLGDGVIWISTGGAAVSLSIEPLENENAILQIDAETGEVT